MWFSYNWYSPFLPESSLKKHEHFEEIESKLLGRDRWNVYDEMQEKAKTLAASLLHEHFPNMRQREKGVPEVKVEKVVEKKSKGIKI